MSHSPPVHICPQNFLNAGSFPEIQGFLQLRGSGRGSGRKLWKRFFCFLRRSGLYYSTKGTSKVKSGGSALAYHVLLPHWYSMALPPLGWPSSGHAWHLSTPTPVWLTYTR